MAIVSTEELRNMVRRNVSRVGAKHVNDSKEIDSSAEAGALRLSLREQAKKHIEELGK